MSSAIITLGYGAAGNTTRLVTLGYSIGVAVTLVYGPARAFAASVYHPGSKAAASYQPGAMQAAVYQPGAKAGTAN